MGNTNPPPYQNDEGSTRNIETYLVCCNDLCDKQINPTVDHTRDVEIGLYAKTQKFFKRIDVTQSWVTK